MEKIYADAILKIDQINVHQPCSPARVLGDPVLLSQEGGLSDVEILVEGESEEEDPFPVKAPSQGRHR